MSKQKTRTTLVNKYIKSMCITKGQVTATFKGVERGWQTKIESSSKWPFPRGRNPRASSRQEIIFESCCQCVYRALKLRCSLLPTDLSVLTQGLARDTCGCNWPNCHESKRRASRWILSAEAFLSSVVHGGYYYLSRAQGQGFPCMKTEYTEHTPFWWRAQDYHKLFHKINSRYTDFYNITYLDTTGIRWSEMECQSGTGIPYLDDGELTKRYNNVSSCQSCVAKRHPNIITY